MFFLCWDMFISIYLMGFGGSIMKSFIDLFLEWVSVVVEEGGSWGGWNKLVEGV